VHHLAGHGEELELHRKAVGGTELDRQEVEVERAVARGVERDHLAARPGVHELVEHLEVGGLAGERGAVIDHLHGDLALRHVDLDHRPSIPRTRDLYGNLIGELLGDM
jgi:hypothetical protein